MMIVMDCLVHPVDMTHGQGEMALLMTKRARTEAFERAFVFGHPLALQRHINWHTDGSDKLRCASSFTDAIGGNAEECTVFQDASGKQIFTTRDHTAWFDAMSTVHREPVRENLNRFFLCGIFSYASEVALREKELR